MRVKGEYLGEEKKKKKEIQWTGNVENSTVEFLSAGQRCEVISWSTPGLTKIHNNFIAE